MRDRSGTDVTSDLRFPSKRVLGPDFYTLAGLVGRCLAALFVLKLKHGILLVVSCDFEYS
jgi:hypothetical protein